jgi:hypothetical protein
LVGISDEIKHLQEESLSMNVKLRNRRAVEGSLKGFLENVVLPPAMVSSICGNEVGCGGLSLPAQKEARA